MLECATELAVIQLPQPGHDNFIASRQIHLAGEIDIGIRKRAAILENVEEEGMLLVFRSCGVDNLLPERFEVSTRLGRIRF